MNEDEDATARRTSANTLAMLTALKLGRRTSAQAVDRVEGGCPRALGAPDALSRATLLGAEATLLGAEA